MQMRLRYIEVFQAVLQAGTLTGAARLLNISQPAATKLLQQAERQLGFPLFNRVRGRLLLTQEAVLLRNRMEKIADELGELRRLVANLKPAGHQTLRIVSTPTLANTLVPCVVTQLREADAELEIELFTQHTREMLNSILLRESDVGLTLQHIDHPGVHCQLLCQGVVVAIGPAGYWPAEQLGEPLPVKALAGAPLVGIALKDELGRRLYAHLEDLPSPPHIATWVQTYQMARCLVGLGHGIALVDPFTATGNSDPAVQVRELKPHIAVSLYAIHRNDSELGRVQLDFLERARTTAAMVMRGQTLPQRCMVGHGYRTLSGPVPPGPSEYHGKSGEPL